MQLGTISRNQIFGLIIFLEIALAGVFSWFYFMPTNKKIDKMQKVVQKKKQDVRETEQSKAQLKKYRGRVEELRDQMKFLERQFKEELFIPRALYLLEKLADATKVEIIAFKPGSGSAKRVAAGAGRGSGEKPPSSKKKSKKTFNEASEFTKYQHELYLICNFRTLYNFLGELSAFPKLVVVDRIEISKDANTTDTSLAGSKRLRVKMPLTFYVQKKQSLVSLEKEEE